MPWQCMPAGQPRQTPSPALPPLTGWVGACTPPTAWPRAWRGFFMLRLQLHATGNRPDLQHRDEGGGVCMLFLQVHKLHKVSSQGSIWPECCPCTALPAATQTPHELNNEIIQPDLGPTIYCLLEFTQYQFGRWLCCVAEPGNCSSHITTAITTAAAAETGAGTLHTSVKARSLQGSQHVEITAASWSCTLMMAAAADIVPVALQQQRLTQCQEHWNSSSLINGCSSS